MKPTRSDFVSSFLRCFAVQGSWNYQSYVGGGLAFAMDPLLRRIHAGDPVRLHGSVERHAASFNGHPYLCPLAVTALARLEMESVEPERIERFRTALRAPLGTLGDHAIWATWRPFCLLAATTAFGLGLSPWLAVAGFLLLYNAVGVGLRLWAFRTGWEHGFEAGRLLRDSWLPAVPRLLSGANVLLLGAAVWALSARLPLEGVPRIAVAGLGSVAALVGYYLPSRGGRLSILAFLVITIIWFALGG